MSKYADWSPVSVFGSTVATSMISTAACSVERQSGPRTVSSKSKVSPKKCDPTATSRPQDDSTRSNNNAESQEDKINVRVCKDARVEREKELAALLLQRQVQVWLLRRQETLRIQEVQRLRKELHHAAASVIRESYRRYTKRLAVGKYLSEVGKFETDLSVLLQGCIARKRQMEEVQRFAAVRRQHEQLQKDGKRKLIHDWLTICMKTRRVKREEQLARAHSKLSGWVLWWTLLKRLEVRVAAREIEKQRQAHRISSVQAIADFYRVCKLRHRAKAELLHRRRCRNGLVVLGNSFRMGVLRRAHSNWNARVSDLKLADEAATKLQRICRTRQVAARFVCYRISILLLQRVFRGRLARKTCARLKQERLQEAKTRELNAAATIIQRCARGHLTRVWFSDVLRKLRERFRCTNCGVIEPSGTYCKYCGRHRTTSGPLWSVLLLHERWQLDRASAQGAPANVEDPEVIASPQKPTLNRSQSSSLKIMTTSSRTNTEDHGHLTSLPVVLSPRHRRVVAQNAGTFARSKSLTNANLDITRRSSISSISEQTARRAAALADLQAKGTATAQAQALEVHLARLQRASTVLNRGITKRASIV